MRPRTSRRAIALVIVLWTSVILMMLVVSLYVSLRGETFFSQQSRDQVSALYVAEAGVAEACEALGANPLWLGVTDKPVVGLDPAHMVVGKYSVRFHTGSGPYLPGESANNLNNALAPGDSYRGTASVPANAALLVVEAKVGLVHRTVEVVVTRGVSTPNGMALFGSEGIELRGNVTVKGIASLTNATQVDALTHSNKSNGSSGDWALNWERPNNNETAYFGGKVSTTSPMAGVSATLGAFASSNGATITDGNGATASAPSSSAPDLDILGAIAAKSGATPLANSFSTSQTLAPGDYHVNGDLVVNGDLNLDKANLYVNGNVTVQGAISGGGSVHVAGKTVFKGDSQVLGGSSGTSVLSHDSIELVGFDGNKFLNDYVASHPGSAIETKWTNVTTNLQALSGLTKHTPFVTATPDASQIVPDAPLVDLPDREQKAIDVCWTLGGNPHNITGITSLDILRSLGNDVGALGGQTASFVQAKLHKSAKIFDYIETSPGQVGYSNAVLTGAVTSPDHQGLLVAAIWGNGKLMSLSPGVTLTNIGNPATRLDELCSSLALQSTKNLNLEKIGNSSFQGLLYTHGAIYAGHEVDVMGAVIAKGRPGIPDLVTNGKTLRAGTVFADNGCQITYIQEEAKAFPTGTGAAHVALWCSR